MENTSTEKTLTPIPAWETKRRSDWLWVIALESRRPLFSWIGGMEVDWNVEFLGPRKKRPVGGIVIEFTLVVIINKGADKTELLDTTG